MTAVTALASRPSTSIDLDNAMPWMVARTENKREKSVQGYIEREGRIAYFPQIQCARTGVIQPLFPTYLFVLDLDGLWRFLFRTYGVVCLIMRSGVPDLMPDETMEALRATERNGLVQVHQFQHGNKVEIVGSAFDGWSGIYDGMSGTDRCRVLLNMLGQQVPVQLKRHHLKLVG